MLKFKIILMITNDLTIGRKDNGLNAFTSDKIDKFIKQKQKTVYFIFKVIRSLS